MGKKMQCCSQFLFLLFGLVLTNFVSIFCSVDAIKNRNLCNSLVLTRWFRYDYTMFYLKNIKRLCNSLGFVSRFTFPSIWSAYPMTKVNRKFACSSLLLTLECGCSLHVVHWMWFDVYIWYKHIEIKS